MFSVVVHGSVHEVTQVILSASENRMIGLILTDFEVVLVRDGLCIVHSETWIAHAVILGILAASDLLD